MKILIHFPAICLPFTPLYRSGSEDGVWEEKKKRGKEVRKQSSMWLKSERESAHKRIHGSYYTHTKNILEYDFCRKQVKKSNVMI